MSPDRVEFGPFRDPNRKNSRDATYTGHVTTDKIDSVVYITHVTLLHVLITKSSALKTSSFRSSLHLLYTLPVAAKLAYHEQWQGKRF